ncbi:hypothetical protein [Solemya velum gill symbiont]|uniref:Uncharacterized protein n=1 Tax=Solemya velum gill symbiont TaxID=2340 RepID=A0A0B0H5V5_SOVGS|nr:hypothetical protein [Solemya velum gill symbiont]KHF24480.1 hypothetical protein JV46_28550 [Solemya velum gill symbiont]OOY34961.1 hypothetical protein BOV88_07570 [Solemya velum gill symbiont]OOY36797.1 hypothetical protein BOV89_10735 [Solemya velum gill symbiont]OOY39817.1 hypothetical protein BOV90_07290 [Solemya velum gill symbiont]OOY42488.1 hypothetical protein BOV91_06815 [Solemya velum gill symbiont]
MRNSVKLLTAIGAILTTSPLLAHGGHAYFTTMEQILHAITNNQHLFAVGGGLVAFILVAARVGQLIKRLRSGKSSQTIIRRIH